MNHEDIQLNLAYIQWGRLYHLMSIVSDPTLVHEDMRLLEKEIGRLQKERAGQPVKQQPDTKPEIENCHNCRFGGMYECRRHAPVRASDEMPMVFPNIYNDGLGIWCGDWEATTGATHGLRQTEDDSPSD